MSRPTRARGLKPSIEEIEEYLGKSRPTRARGLKHARMLLGYRGAPSRAPRGRVD